MMVNMETTPNTRDQAIKTIRAALKARSGKSWSVKGGTGTSWGWISIDTPPARRANAAAEREELATLLALPAHMVSGGAQVPADDKYRTEYIARAQGVTPLRNGVPYWD